MVAICIPALRAGIGARESGQLRVGAELNGASIKQDDDSTRELYGRPAPFRDTLSWKVATPPQAQAFVEPGKNLRNHGAVDGPRWEGSWI